MRALCLTATGGPDHLALLDLPSPALTAPDQVRIGIRAVALNHLDLWVAEGLPAVPIATFPHVVAADGAGVVLEVGSAVTGLRVGDRVVINPGISCGTCEACTSGEEVFCRAFSLLGEHRPGTAAEEVVLPARNVVPISGEWSWAEAAAFGLSSVTAWRMLTTRARLAAGETVLIWGIGGGVALQALQIARHLGARVAVTSSSPGKRERALALGAELALDHGGDVEVPSAVKAHFGHGVDVVVDSVGAPTWSRSCRALRPGGRLVTCGATGGPEVALDLRRLFWFQWSLLGSTMGTTREFAEIVELGNRGLLRPIIDQVFLLAAGGDAYRRLAEAAQFGKLVLEVTP
ncbi:MAG: zinc-binding dehydrogenase [Gemmatimonadales bacterium]